MLTKNACDVLAVIATNNLMNKEASAVGRAGARLLKNLPFYRNMLKGFARQAIAPAKGLVTDARALGRLGMRGARHGAQAAGQYIDDAAQAAMTAGKNAAGAAAKGAREVGKGMQIGAKAAGEGALKAGKYMLSDPLRTAGTAAAVKYLLGDNE